MISFETILTSKTPFKRETGRQTEAERERDTHGDRESEIQRETEGM